MKYTSAMLGIILVFLCGPAYSGPYVLYGLETSDSPHRDTEWQNRMEVGYDYEDTFQFYAYHESDPRNGLEGTGYVGETENGVGIRLRYEWE